MSKRRGFVIVLLLLWGCGEGDSFTVRVRFPDDASRERAVTLRVMSVIAEEGGSCAALTEGSASPGDAFYTVEDMVTIDLSAGESGRALEVLEEGPRLFFADVTDTADVVYLRGCAEATAGGAGVQEVLIELVVVEEPCETDSDCEDDGLWCNGELHCVEGDCVLEERDCADGDVCTEDVCNEDLDRCEHPPVEEAPAVEGPVGDASCGDGVDNDCDTLTDDADPACKVCAEDTECDDLNACTDDRCESERCVNEAVQDGAACDDGQYCTEGDQCTGGRCRGTARDCSGLESDCATATCDEEADQCVAVPVPDGTVCDDERWCTLSDGCQAGVCTGEDRDCSAQAAECVAGVCNEDTDACESQPIPDGALCEDGEFCTVGERCTGGACGGGTARDCSATGGGCVDGLCDEDMDACVGDPLAAGTPCADDLFCTVSEACDGAGSCVGEDRDCSMLTNQCNDGICHEDADACVAQPANEGQLCDDGLWCTVDEACALGVCAGGADQDCDDGDVCTQDSCDEANDGCANNVVVNPGAEGPWDDATCGDTVDNDCDLQTDGDDPDCQQCTDDLDCDDGNACTVNSCDVDGRCQTVAEPDGTGCDDGLFCTEPDACTGGVCGGQARDCSGLTDDCNQGVCNETAGRCEAQAVNEGQGCDDGTFCTVAETCQAGACTGGVARDCSQLDDDCNTGACNETAGQCEQQAANEGGACDDGQFCNVNETCQGGACAGGGPRTCSAMSDDCNDGVCDEQADQCEAQPVADGTECGARSCTGTDWMRRTCLDGACSELALEEACDDGAWCNGVETCDPGTGCGSGTPPSCDDGVNCTDDSCDEGSDSCEAVANDANCDNGVFCDGVESCDAQAGCLPGSPPDCDDGYPCTTDSCEAVSDQCEHAPNAGGCPEIHIGPAANTCPHDGPSGPTTACDYTGFTGIMDAANAAPAAGAVFLIYDDLGGPAEFQGGDILLPGGSYIGAAPGVDPANAVISAEDLGPDPNAGIVLTGDNCHVERLTIVVVAGGRTAISAWGITNDPATATGGHLIENVVGKSVSPEMWGWNSTQEPIYMGPDSTLRNSYFSGYFETSWNLQYADNARIVDNTFVHYQSTGGRLNVTGADGVTWANNVLIKSASVVTEAVTADATTTNLTVTGNVFEGYADLAPGATDASNVIQDNLLGPAPLESPLVPVFLSDATNQTGLVVPGEGQSLDGVDVDGQTGILPGAFQNRSGLSLPRRTVIKVGESSNACNGPCDITAAEDNEIQKAVWSAFRGATVEVYPSATPYAGNAIVCWPLTIVGMGNQPEDVELQSAEEDQELTYYRMWDRHNSVITVLKGYDDKVHVENLTIRVDAAAVTDSHAILTEYPDLTASIFWNEFRRIRVESTGTDAGLLYALYLGDHNLVQDVLIHGDFNVCIRFGYRRDSDELTPNTTNRVVNLTCRLTGTGSHAPQAGLDVAGLVDTILANIAIQFPAPDVFMRAQRRTDGTDTGANALDMPTSYTMHSVTVQNWGTHSNGFNTPAGATETNVVNLPMGDPFFVGPGDSHLDPACTSAYDAGVDPSTLNPELAPGTSLDGVDRAGRVIDQGCYEDGM